MAWIQYNLLDGSQVGSCSQQVNDNDLALFGRGQIFRDGDTIGLMVDVTQNPPVLIMAPSPPPPPADMLTHIFNAMVQQGWIDPANVDPAIIAQANASLVVTGAKTIP